MEQNVNIKHKILKYGLYLLVFLLPWQTRWMFRLGELNGGYWEYGTMSLYGWDILFIGLLIATLLNCSIVKLLDKRIWLLIGGLELLVFISIFFASDKWLALYGYGRFLVGIGLFFLIISIKYDKIKMYWSIVTSGFLQSLLAMYQFFTQSVFSSKWLGMAAQDPIKLGISVIDTGLRRWLRAYGSLPHPNILGGFLVICLILNIILHFNLLQKYKVKKNNKVKIGLYISSVIFSINLIGLLLTFSRSAWIGFIVGFLVLTFLVIKKYKGQGAINLSIFFAIIILIGSGFIWGLREPLNTRFNLNNRLEYKSIQERMDYSAEAKQAIKNHWLFGTGMHNYGLAVYNEIDSERTWYEYQPVHNVFLLVWAEIGIVGLLLFIVLLIVTLLHCYIVTLSKCGPGKISIVIAMIVMMFFDHWWWSLGFGIMLWWLVVGVCYSRIRE